MDILLTHGYFLSDDPHEMKVMKPYPPLGILYISAYLKQRGYNVGVFDSTFCSLADLEVALKRERPAVLGIYGTLMTKPGVLKLIRISKGIGVHVVLGGPEPANYFAEYIGYGADVVVMGEGESALEDLLPRLIARGPHGLEGITGIAYRRSDGSISPPLQRPLLSDLDSLPLPDREAIEMNRYLDAWQKYHGVRSVSLICARGCPYRCAWCSHSVFGHSHRRRSPRHVASEIEHLIELYKPDQFWYSDDVFTIHRSWLFEYAAELKKRGLSAPFECISRADRLDDEVIKLLAEMGCFRLWLGSESGSQRVLDEMKRDVKIEQVQAITRALKRRGIQTGMFIMLGYEGEDLEDIEASVEHLKKAAPDVFLTTVAYPIKGTEYYSRIQDRIVAGERWETTTDRDLIIRGRHSRRFYSFATRWVVNSVALHKARTDREGIGRISRAAVNVLIGRAGMRLTKNEFV